MEETPKDKPYNAQEMRVMILTLLQVAGTTTPIHSVITWAKIK